MDWSKLFSYVIGRADKKTADEVECWRRENSRNEDFFRRASGYYASDPIRNESFSEEQLDALYLKLQRSRKQKHQRVMWQRIAVVAASVVLFISLGIWWHRDASSLEGDRVSLVVTRQPDQAGSVVVIMETGDRLTSGEPAPKVVRRVEKDYLNYTATDSMNAVDTTGGEKRVQTHKIVVPRGKTFELVLSDGTLVILNPESELTYPVSFDSLSVREVTLRGEALFKVTPSSIRFVVNTGNMKLQVYGTTFNVFSRVGLPDEAVLLEGVVGITPRVSGVEETLLRPGEKSSVEESGRVAVEPCDLDEYLAKRNGYLLFDGKTIEQILRQLEVYYDVNFVVDKVILGTKEYVCSIKRHAPLREALEVIEFISDVKFIITGKEVKVISE